MRKDKAVVGKALINVVKQIREKKKKKMLNYIYDDKKENEGDVRRMPDVSFEDTLLRKGDIITISPAYSAVLTPVGVGSMELGEVRFSEEVWEVLAVNGLHIKLKRMTDLSGNFQGEVFIIQKEDYDFSYAEDFVD
jgi:hypothetical protein